MQHINPKIEIKNKTTTFEAFVDPQLENRKIDNFDALFPPKEEIKANTSQQNKSEISSEDSSEDRLIVNKEGSSSNSSSLLHERIMEIINTNNKKYFAYMKINEFLAKESKEDEGIKEFIIWRALSKKATISFEDVFGVLFHTDSNTTRWRLSKQLGEILKLEHLPVESVTRLIRCIETTPEYKDEIESADPKELDRSPGPLLYLVQQLQTYAFYNPEALGNINSFARKFFDPAIKSSLNFLKTSDILTTKNFNNIKNSTDVENLSKKLDNLVQNIGAISYEKNKEVKLLVENLSGLCEKYFIYAIALAAKFPGMVVKSMKETVGNQVAIYLTTFLRGEKNSEVKNKFVEINNNHYFIAHITDFETGKPNRTLMKIETIINFDDSDDNNSQEKGEKLILSRVTREDSLFKNLPKYGKDFFIKNILETTPDEYVFVFENKDNNSLAYAILKKQNDNFYLELTNLDEKSLPEQSQFIYPSYAHKKNKILPNQILMLVASFLNHKAMGGIIDDLTSEIKDDLISEWKKDKNIKSIPDMFLRQLADKTANFCKKTLSATFSVPMMKIISLLPLMGEKNYPLKKEDQSKLIGPLDTAAGVNYIGAKIFYDKLSGETTRHKNLFGTQFAFLDKQDKTQVLTEESSKGKKRKTHDIGQIAKYHYEFLKTLRKPEMSDENFYSFALSDFILNGLPIKEIVKEIVPKHAEKPRFEQLEKILLAPIDHIKVENDNLSCIQLAFLCADRNFFENLTKKNVLSKNILIVKSKSIAMQVEKMMPFIENHSNFYNWFNVNIVELPKLAETLLARKLSTADMSSISEAKLSSKAEVEDEEKQIEGKKGCLTM